LGRSALYPAERRYLVKVIPAKHRTKNQTRRKPRIARMNADEEKAKTTDAIE